MSTHVIAPGDNPSSLALRYTGTASRWPELCAANPSLPRHATYGCVFTVGKTLTLPDSWVPAAPSTSSSIVPGGTVPSSASAPDNVVSTVSALIPGLAPSSAPTSSSAPAKPGLIPEKIAGFNGRTVVIAGAGAALLAAAFFLMPDRKMAENRRVAQKLSRRALRAKLAETAEDTPAGWGFSWPRGPGASMTLERISKAKDGGKWFIDFGNERGYVLRHSRWGKHQDFFRSLKAAANQARRTDRWLEKHGHMAPNGYRKHRR